MANWLGKRYAVPLHHQAEALRQYPLSEAIKQHPPKPIVSIDATTCLLINNAVAFRNLFILPWLFGLCLTLWWNVDDFIKTWTAAENFFNERIESRKKTYGDDFFENTSDTYLLGLYSKINAQGEMPLENYIQYRYFDTAKVGGTRRLQVDIGLAIVYLIAIPGLLFWAIRFPRHGPLIFDRERQLVYHWSKGKAYVQRFERLRIDEQTQFLVIQLRGEKKNGDMGWAKFNIQPTRNPYYNGKTSYQPVLAYVLQYMEQGLSQVLPGKQSWQGKQPFFFFDDKKPTDFEAQLTDLLARLDNYDDDLPLDAQGLPITPT